MDSCLVQWVQSLNAQRLGELHKNNTRYIRRVDIITDRWMGKKKSSCLLKKNNNLKIKTRLIFSVFSLGTENKTQQNQTKPKPNNTNKQKL